MAGVPEFWEYGDHLFRKILELPKDLFSRESPKSVVCFRNFRRIAYVVLRVALRR